MAFEYETDVFGEMELSIRDLKVERSELSRLVREVFKTLRMLESSGFPRSMRESLWGEICSLRKNRTRVDTEIRDLQRTLRNLGSPTKPRIAPFSTSEKYNFSVLTVYEPKPVLHLDVELGNDVVYPPAVKKVKIVSDYTFMKRFRKQCRKDKPYVAPKPITRDYCLLERLRSIIKIFIVLRSRFVDRIYYFEKFWNVPYSNKAWTVYTSIITSRLSCLYGNERVKAEMDMISNVSGYFKRKVEASVVESVKDRVSKVLSAVPDDEIADEDAVLEGTLTDVLETVSDTTSISKDTLGRIVSQLIHISINPTMPTIIWSICNSLVELGLVCVKWVKRIVASMLRFLRTWANKVSGTKKTDTVPCASGEMAAPNEDDQISASVMSACASGLLAVVKCKDKKLPKSLPDFTSMLVKGFPSFCKDSNFIYRWFSNNLLFFKRIFNWLYDYVFPKNALAREIVNQSDKLKDLMASVLWCLDARNRSAIERDPESHLKVYETAALCDQLLLDLAVNSKHYGNFTVVKEWCGKMLKLRDEISLKISTPAARFEPFVLCVSGPSNVGKSHIANQVAINLLNSIGYRSYEEPIYVRTPANPYWNGLRNQPVIYYDDYLQINTGDDALRDVGELFNLKSKAIFNPPMAAIPDKERRINPFLVYLNCNEAFPTVNGVTKIEAFYRRRDSLWKVVVNPNCLAAMKAYDSKKEVMNIHDVPKDIRDSFEHIRFVRYLDVTDAKGLEKDKYYTKSEFEKIVQEQFIKYYNNEIKEYYTMLRRLRELYPTDKTSVDLLNKDVGWFINLSRSENDKREPELKEVQTWRKFLTDYSMKNIPFVSLLSKLRKSVTEKDMRSHAIAYIRLLGRRTISVLSDEEKNLLLVYLHILVSPECSYFEAFTKALMTECDNNPAVTGNMPSDKKQMIDQLAKELKIDIRDLSAENLDPESSLVKKIASESTVKSKGKGKNGNRPVVPEPAINAKAEMDAGDKPASEPIQEQASNVVIVSDVAETVAEPIVIDQGIWPSLSNSSEIGEFNVLTDRWQLFDLFTWNKNNHVGENLLRVAINGIAKESLIIPRDLVDKMRDSPNNVIFNNYTYCNCDVEIKFLVNANKFQVGQLQASFYYGANLDLYYQDRDNLGCASQMTNARLKAGESNSAVLRIPFRYYKPWMPIYPIANDRNNLDMGVLRLKVLNQLRVPDGQPDHCTITMYYRYKNLNFVGMRPRSIGAEMFSVTNLKSAVKAAETTLNTLFPDENRDNPPDVFPIKPIIPQSAQSWCLGDQTFEPINPLRLQALGQTPHPPGSLPNEPEMMIDYVKKVWGLCESLHWSRTSQLGTILRVYPASPILRFDQYYNVKCSNPDERLCAVLPPVAVVAEMFSMWRGSIEFMFDFVNTQYHTGRLMIAYVPRMSYTKVQTLTLQQLTTCDHVILDIRETSEYVYKQSFISDKPFWTRRAGYSKSPEVLPPGHIVIAVANQLTSPDTVADSIDINIFVRGGDDLSFAVPCQPNIGLSFNTKLVIPSTSTVTYLPAYGPPIEPLGVAGWRYIRNGAAALFRYGDGSDHITQFSNLRYKTVYQLTSDDIKINHPEIISDSNLAYMCRVPDPQNLVDQYVYAAPFATYDQASKFAASYKENVQSIDEKIDWSKLHTISKSGPYNTYAVVVTWKRSHARVQGEDVEFGDVAVAEMDERRLDEGVDVSIHKQLVNNNASLLLFGEVFNDLRQITRRYQFYAYFMTQTKKSGNTTQGAVIVGVFPQGLDVDPQVNNSVENPFANKCRDGLIPIICSGYRFYRGSVRFRMIISSTKMESTYVWVQHKPDLKSNGSKIVIVGGDKVGLEYMLNQGYATLFQGCSINGIVTFEVPYYLPGQFGLLQRPDFSQKIDALHYSLGSLVISVNANVQQEVHCYLFYSHGDDMTLSVFQGFPPMLELDVFHAQAEMGVTSEGDVHYGTCLRNKIDSYDRVHIDVLDSKSVGKYKALELLEPKGAHCSCCVAAHNNYHFDFKEYGFGLPGLQHYRICDVNNADCCRLERGNECMRRYSGWITGATRDAIAYFTGLTLKEYFKVMYEAECENAVDYGEDEEADKILNEVAKEIEEHKLNWWQVVKALTSSWGTLFTFFAKVSFVMSLVRLVVSTFISIKNWSFESSLWSSAKNVIGIEDKDKLLNSFNAKNVKLGEMASSGSSMSVGAKAMRDVVVAKSQATPCVEECIYRLIIRNTFWIKAVPSNGRSLVGKCLGLCGHAFIGLDHYFYKFMELDEDTKFFYVTRDVCIPIDFKSLKFSSMKDSAIIIGYAPVTIPNFKDLRKFIMPQNATRNIGRYGKMLDWKYDGSNFVMNDNVLELQVQDRLIVDNDSQYGNTYVERLFKYKKHYPGMCGSILIANWNTSAPIIGIHIAGDDATNNGFAEAVVHESFASVFRDYEPITVLEESLVDPQKALLQINTNVEKLGTLPKKMVSRQPEKSRLVNTECAGVFSPINYDLPLLSPKDPRIKDAPFSPLVMGCENHGLVAKPFPTKALELAVDDLKSKIFATVTPIRSEVGVISQEAAIVGIPEFTEYDKLDFNTSEGFPLTQHRPPGATNKRWLLNLRETQYGYECPSVHPRLQKLLDDHEQLRKDGFIPETYFVNCLKDNKMKKEKACLPGKTRIIGLSPLEFTIAVRRYFSDFSTAYQRARFDAEHAIGIDIKSYEVTQMINLLMTKGDNFITGDYSKFGDTLLADCVKAAFDIMIEWFVFYGDDSSVNRKVRYAMMYEVMHSKHVMNDLLYLTFCGMPSGNPLTVVINSMVNSLYLRCAWLLIMSRNNRADLLDLTSFNKHVCVITYGDDLIATVSESVKSLYNTVALSEVFSEYDIKFTDATKSGTMKPLYRLSDKETSFLKHTFHKHPKRKGIWIAKLDDISAKEIYHWCWSTNYDIRESSIEACKAALEESYGHGPEYYNDLLKRMVEYWAHKGVHFTAPRWEHVDSRIFDKIWF